MSMRDDPQQPSTSTASERRREENLKRFNRIFFSHQHQTTLLHACTEKTRGRLISLCRPEIRKLRGLLFPVVLKPHQKYLNDLCRMSGTTFSALCEDLRFLADFKKQPPSMSDSEHCIPLFKLVANCVVFQDNQWNVRINRQTLFDTVTADSLKRLNIVETKSGEFRPDNPEKAPDPELRRNPKRCVPSAAALRIPESKKLKKPPKPIPEPFQAHRFSNFSPLADEHLCAKHLYNNLLELDTEFFTTVNVMKLKIRMNSLATRNKEQELSDMEYWSDDVVLLPQHISFRLEHVAQISDFPFPQVEDDGYFPPDRPDRPWYLYEKYTQSNADCKETFNKLRPPAGNPMPSGFSSGVILPQELLHFHNTGRHIHGFFDVWEEKDRGYQVSDGKWICRRYLVDIYNHFMFPLYIEVEDWCETLKMAFDKISFYNLKLITVVKKHFETLKNIGSALFSSYPVPLEKHLSNNQTAKVRSAYLHQIQLENARVVDFKNLMDGRVVINGFEDDGRRKVRRSRKADAQNQDPSNPKAISTKPRNKSTSTAARAAQLQKENVNKMMMSPPSTSQPAAAEVAGTGVMVPAAAPSAPTTPAKRKSLENPRPQNPPSATKRRHDDVSPQLQPLPIKKPMLVDSWDEHTHRAMEEEHVDEEDEAMPPEAVTLSQSEVWKPREEEGVSPEEYASKILEHYGVKKGEDCEPATESSLLNNTFLLHSQPPSSIALPPGPLADLVADMPNEIFQSPAPLPPPMPNVKPRRSRKKASMDGPPPEPQELQQAQQLQQPSTSTAHVLDDVPARPPASVTPRSMVNGANGSNGSVSQGNPKTNRTYSMKPATNSQNKAVFPVKKLTSTLNGTTPAPSILSPNPAMRNAQAQIARRTGNQQQPTIAEPLNMHPHQPGSIGFSKEVMAMAAGAQVQATNRTPYFQTGMRPKPPVFPPPNGSDAASVLQPSPAASVSSAASSSSNTSSIRPPASTTCRVPIAQPRIIQQTTPHRQSLEQNTPASRAINHLQLRQIEGAPEADKCQRGIPYNDQMAYKKKSWPKQPHSVPSNSLIRTLPEAEIPVGIPQVAVPPILAYRPRSDSNNGSRQARQMLAIPPVVAPTETSVGDPNPRQSVPWVGNSNRARSASTSRSTSAAMDSAMPTTPVETSGPLLPASMATVNVPRTTTTAYTIMDSINQATPPPPVTSSTTTPTGTTRTYTNYSRKAHSFTPEELGLAVRSGSARFQEQQNGDGPTVKSFLMNLNQQLK